MVASAAAVAEHTLAPSDLSRGPGRVDVGQRLSLEALATRLVEAGYSIEPIVDGPGQAARRGGLVDAWPVDSEHPFRLEFLGSEVESIRSFDPATQRTIERLDTVVLGPATEWFPARDDLVAVAEHLGSARRPEIDDERRSLQFGELPAPAFYGPLAASASLLDHLRPGWRLLIDEPTNVAAALHDLDELARERRADLASKGELGAGAPFPHAPQPAIESALESFRGRADLARWATGHEPGAFRLPFQVADAYAGRLPAAAEDARRRTPRGDRTLVVTQQAQRYGEILAEHSLDARVRLDLVEPPAAGELALVQGALPEGWQVGTSAGVILLQTDRELFGFTKRRRQLRRRETHRSQFLAEVQPGDFVVHADHGIARFGGIVRRPVGDEDRDYLELRYAGDDRLYVPIDQVDRVSRFVGPSDRPPRLTRLGTQEWARARARVREAVALVAADLVRLYAARQLLEGHAFKPDTEWQRELEAAFPYEETPDQLQAIAEVKADMESPRPMDRLICGDVGFGKTEVAIRAAFKAVMDGYQVAVLVPTTVLAQQHYNTFRERLAGFPVTLEMLSRFRSDEEAREVIRDAQGRRGRHRDRHAPPAAGRLEFKNLGLVVIDEEQRFGVAHKERLKRMRLEVDVLTLTATPIPRTLHMALAGRPRHVHHRDAARGPAARADLRRRVGRPAGPRRHPARARARRSDLRRAQPRAVHRRVRRPSARARPGGASRASATGRCRESLLERVMVRFADGEFDVLVCTTIIESGLDIPNVNTLIVDSADRLGLAQLYQLRGRVGRSAHQAYAYLLHTRDRVLTEEAQQRLAAIFEANELGAGFQVALHDLEIRGAGNLLGAEQSGHIAVGRLRPLHEDARRGRGIDARRPRGPRTRRSRRSGADPASTCRRPPSSRSRTSRRWRRVSRSTSASPPSPRSRSARRCARRLPTASVRSPQPSTSSSCSCAFASPRALPSIAVVRLEDDDVVLVAEDRAAFARRRLPELPRGVRVGQQQVRVSRAALGRDWLPATEALLQIIGGTRQLQPA